MCGWLVSQIRESKSTGEGVAIRRWLSQLIILEGKMEKEKKGLDATCGAVRWRCPSHSSIAIQSSGNESECCGSDRFLLRAIRLTIQLSSCSKRSKISLLATNATYTMRCSRARRSARQPASPHWFKCQKMRSNKKINTEHHHYYHHHHHRKSIIS